MKIKDICIRILARLITDSSSYPMISGDDRAKIQEHGLDFTTYATDKIYILDTVFNNITLYYRALGDKLTLFIAAAAMVDPQFFTKSRFYAWIMRGYFNVCSAYLLNTDNVLNAVDLDRLWVLFYVTGDKKYADRVKFVATDQRQVFEQAAAIWSYNSHINMGCLFDMPLSFNAQRLIRVSPDN